MFLQPAESDRESLERRTSTRFEGRSDFKPSIGRCNWGRLTILGAGLVWCVGIGLGYSYTGKYSSVAARTSRVPGDWPAETSCQLSKSRPTLVMFLHPYCPCSRASLYELEALLQQHPGKLTVQVLFWHPQEFAEAGMRSELWELARALRGARLWSDIDGAEQRRFQAQASGEVFLYHPTGKLLFHGGITASRGQIGRSLGHEAIESVALGQVPVRSRCSVYGCEFGHGGRMSQSAALADRGEQ